MGLSVCAFVPDGIVIASDSLAEIRHQDDGFYQEGFQRLYSVNNRFLVAFEGPCFHQGLPLSFYLTPLFKRTWSEETVVDFSRSLILELEKILSEEIYVLYVAGYEVRGNGIAPAVALIHNKEVSLINQDSVGNPVYNYHAIGRTYWVNKLLMNTQAVLDEEHISFQKYEIDFSKFSLVTAKDFVLSLASLSEKMDHFSQLKPIIGGQFLVGIVKPYEGVSVSFNKPF